MKRFLLAATALISLAAINAASAADLALKAPPPPPVVDVWTGWYAGLNLGGSWGKSSTYYSGTGVGFAPFTSSQSMDGVLGGGQIGYNYQWSSFVAGVETDFDWADIRGTGAVGTTAPTFAPFTTTAQQKLTSLGTFRGRLGVAADRALFYVTGGLAYGRTQLNTSVTTPTVGCGPVGLCGAASSTQWQTGWTAGGGLEYAFAAGWSGRVEYLHYDLGSHTQGQFDPADVAPIPVFNSSATFRGDIIRGGINYRFGG